MSVQKEKVRSASEQSPTNRCGGVATNRDSLSRRVMGACAVPVSWGSSGAKPSNVEVEKQLGTAKRGPPTRCFVSSPCHRLAERQISNSDGPRPSLGRTAKQLFLRQESPWSSTGGPHCTFTTAVRSNAHEAFPLLPSRLPPPSSLPTQLRLRRHLLQ